MISAVGVGDATVFPTVGGWLQVGISDDEQSPHIFKGLIAMQSNELVALQEAAKAYRVASAFTADPREAEANLLLKAAAKLKAIQDTWDQSSLGLDEALRYNRKVWLILVAAATEPDNPLPTAIRQNVANIGIFVFKRTVEMMAEPHPDQLSCLIRINRDLAAGLTA